MTDAAKRKEASVHRNMPKAEKKKGQAACKPSDGHGNLEGLRTTREHGRSLCRLTWREHLQEAAKKNTSIVDSKRERSWLLITDRAIREGANSSLSWADIFRSRLSWAATREPQSERDGHLAYDRLASAATLFWGIRVTPAIFFAAFLVDQLIAGSVVTFCRLRDVGDRSKFPDEADAD